MRIYPKNMKTLIQKDILPPPLFIAALFIIVKYENNLSPQRQMNKDVVYVYMHTHTRTHTHNAILSSHKND